MWLESTRTQGRVIHALILREVRTRFGVQKLGYLWAILEPMVFVSLFVMLATLRGRFSPSGMPVMLFMMTGFVPFFLFRDTANVSLLAIQSNASMLTFPQVAPSDLIIARAILEFATMTVVFVLLLVAAASIGVTIRIERPMEVFFWISIMGVLGVGVGGFAGAFAPLFPSMERLIPVLMRPLFWVSGLFFTAEMLPAAIREYALINPILHMLELLRSAFFYEFESDYASASYALYFAFTLMLMAGIAHRALRKRILIAVQTI